jgi:alpha-L-rhamnosidase
VLVRADAGRHFQLIVTIPANTTAMVLLPANSNDDVTESGKPLAAGGPARLLRWEAGSAVLDVAAGTYHFTSRGERGSP